MKLSTLILAGLVLLLSPSIAAAQSSINILWDLVHCGGFSGEGAVGNNDDSAFEMTSEKPEEHDQGASVACDVEDPGAAAGGSCTLSLETNNIHTNQTETTTAGITCSADRRTGEEFCIAHVVCNDGKYIGCNTKMNASGTNASVSLDSDEFGFTQGVVICGDGFANADSCY